MAQHLDPKFLEHIGSVLLGTLSADSSVRSDAESTLFSLENQSTPNLLPSLLALSSSDIDPSIRQAAVLRLKNLVVSIWRLQPVHSYDNKARPQIVLSESDRQYLKMHIVPAIVQCGPFTKVRVQLLEVFYHIARVEFPDQWQDVYSICVQQVHSKSNIYSVLGGIACIRMLYKAQDNSPNENKEYFQALGRDALPLVLMTARETLSNESNKFLNPEAFPNEFEASMMIIKLIVKIFFLATKTEIDHVLFVQNLTFLHEWMEFLATIQLTDPGFGVKSISLPKAKKWAGRVMVRMIWRYCGEKDVEPRYKELGKYFLQNIAPKSVQIALGTMESMTKIADIHKLDKVHVLYSTLEFIRFAIKYSALYTKQIKPKLNLILFQTIFRIFLLNEEEKFLLSNSPEEFIMKRVEDELAEHGFTDLRMSASSLLTKLLSVRTRDTLSLVWNGMVSILQNDNTDPYHIDSALRILGNISSLLLSKPAVQSEVERIWMSYLLPKATVSAHSVVRARAQDFFGKFSGIVFLNNNDQLEQATVNSILKAVFEESDLFVKYEAILSLSLWLKREDCTIAKEMAAPYLGQLLNTIFAFLDHSMQNEEIVSSLDTIIDVFGEMIAPYALEIVRRFISIYNSLLNSTEDDENAVLTAVSAIRSINTLLYSVSDVKELWPELENLTQSIIQTGLSAQGMEVLEDVLDMITSFTYYPAEISPLVWSYLPMIGSVFHDFAGDALEEMLPAIDNYISKGSEVFVNGSNGAYLHVVLSITSAVLTDPNRSYEIKPACAILASIFIHCHEFENVKSQFPVILKLVAERFMAIKDDLKCGLSTKLSLLKVVSLFSYVNPALFIETLEGFGAGSIQLVNEWINLSTEMKAFNQKVFILGVSSLLRLRCVSPSPDKFLPSLLNQLVNVLTCLRKEAELGVHQDNAVFSEKYGQYDDEGFLDVPEEEDFIEEGDGQLPADAAFLQDMIANSGGYASDLSYLIRGDDDDDDGEGTQDSPIDRVDPFDYFRMCASEVHKADSRLFSSLVGTLSPEQQALFHQHLG